MCLYLYLYNTDLMKSAKRKARSLSDSACSKKNLKTYAPGHPDTHLYTYEASLENNPFSHKHIKSLPPSKPPLCMEPHSQPQNALLFTFPPPLPYHPFCSQQINPLPTPTFGRNVIPSPPKLKRGCRIDNTFFDAFYTCPLYRHELDGEDRDGEKSLLGALRIYELIGSTRHPTILLPFFFFFFPPSLGIRMIALKIFFQSKKRRKKGPGRISMHVN